jgi:hypothetical protein
MRIVKIVLICLAVLFVLIQFVRIDRSNPPVVPENSIEAAVNVPADIEQIFGRSCNDCHSNKTVYPWYTQVAPVSWWLRNHIDDGRRELNLNEFATYPARKQDRKLEEVCDQVKSGEMPLPSYLIVHGGATLSEQDKQTICDWTSAARASIPKPAPTPASAQ